MLRNWPRIVVAGLAGTLVMTAVGLWVAPMMGIPRMNPAEMLAMQMGGNAALGWMAHLMIGIILAGALSLVGSFLPGPPAVRGALFSLAPWLVAMAIMMPMMGMPMFTGGPKGAIGSLIGHLVFGCIAGSVLGRVWQVSRPDMRAAG